MSVVASVPLARVLTKGKSKNKGVGLNSLAAPPC